MKNKLTTIFKEQLSTQYPKVRFKVKIDKADDELCYNTYLITISPGEIRRKIFQIEKQLEYSLFKDFLLTEIVKTFIKENLEVP